MTSSSTKIQAATDGGTTTDHPPARAHGLSVLRSIEAKSLISLVQDALDETHHVGYALHSAIYGFEPAPASWTRPRLTPSSRCCEALTCLETADHYLRMLGSVLDEREAQTANRRSGPAVT